MHHPNPAAYASTAAGHEYFVYASTKIIFLTG
jgi:hypothetical protein